MIRRQLKRPAPALATLPGLCALGVLLCACSSAPRRAPDSEPRREVERPVLYGVGAPRGPKTTKASAEEARAAAVRAERDSQRGGATAGQSAVDLAGPRRAHREAVAEGRETARPARVTVELGGCDPRMGPIGRGRPGTTDATGRIRVRDEREDPTRGTPTRPIKVKERDETDEIQRDQQRRRRPKVQVDLPDPEAERPPEERPTTPPKGTLIDTGSPGS